MSAAAHGRSSASGSDLLRHQRHCEVRAARRSNLRRARGRDCFAEFILGLAEGKTRGLAMTIKDSEIHLVRPLEREDLARIVRGRDLQAEALDDLPRLG